MAAMKSGDNPSNFDVDEVQDYLDSASASERKRVLDAEKSGKNRKGVMEHKGAVPGVTVPAAGGDNELGTEGTKAADSSDAGDGESAETDKVLSQDERVEEDALGKDETANERWTEQAADVASQTPAQVAHQAAAEAGQKAAEENLKQVRKSAGSPRGAVAGNQNPVTVTGKVLRKGIPTGAVIKVTPLVPISGGDGTRISVATKLADNVWTPFKAPANTGGLGAAAAATATTSTGQKNATIAANALTKF